MNKNKIYELLSEGNITDAVSTLLEELEGPELDNEAKELENEATEEKELEVCTEIEDNQDVYPADEHKEVEEVKEVVVESDQVAAGPELKEPKELENEATEEKEPEEDNLEKDNQDVYPEDEHKEVKEVVVEGVDSVATEEKAPETMEQKVDNQDVYPEDEHKEVEEVKEVVVENSVVEDILDSNPEAEKAEETFENPEQVAPTASETAEEVERLLDTTPAEAPKEVELSESMKAIFSILDRINESAQVAAGPELKEPKELENEATEENKAEEKAEVKDNQDVYPADEHKEVEEVKEVVVESAPRKHKSDDTGLSHIETKYEYYDDNDAEDGEKRRVVATKKSVDHVDSSEEILSKEDRVNKGKSGRKYGSLKEELDNVATEERAPETMEQAVDNKDVYNAPEHKEVKEVVEVVVEAAKLCSENGVPATLENITRYAKTLFESESVALNVEVPADKEYDVDAAIESSEMNGNKEEFETCEELQGKGAEAAKAEESVVEAKDLQETVKYTSLREACLLDEDYFVTDSYTVQTADEKQAKLTEQISLLMAREAMDPLYDELLRASTSAQRLQEACVRKYSAKAKEKAKNITGVDKK